MSKIIGKCIITIELDCEKPEGYGVNLAQDVIQRIVMRDDITDGRVLSEKYYTKSDYILTMERKEND